jgi:hypothetical protein
MANTVGHCETHVMHVQDAGFELCFFSGFALSASRLAMPVSSYMYLLFFLRVYAYIMIHVHVMYDHGVLHMIFHLRHTHTYFIFHLRHTHTYFHAYYTHIHTNTFTHTHICTHTHIHTHTNTHVQDVGLATYTEMVEGGRAVCEAVTIPVRK